MIYPIKYNIFYKKSNLIATKKGFSLIEILVVISIFSILFSLSSLLFNSFKSNSNLEITTTTIVEALRLAKANAQSGKDDSRWGIKIFSTEVKIFKGNSYAQSAPTNNGLTFPSNITATGLSEIIFEKVTGSTLTTGTITITNSAKNKNITINEKGTIFY